MDASQRSPATAVISLIGLLFLVLPLAVVVLFSFHETASLSLPFTGFSLRWYKQVLSSAEFLSATRHSLIVASGVAVTVPAQAVKRFWKPA